MNILQSPLYVTEGFEHTCPLLLSAENQLDPYLEIESFFNGASLGYYRFKLRYWLRIAMTEDMEVKNHSNLIYLHNQLIKLLQAGYLIIENNIKYQSKNHYLEQLKGLKSGLVI